MTDAISLTIPHAKPYHGVARLVLGGLAARMNLSFETLEDLQLALESLLANEYYVAGGDVTVEMSVDPRAVHVTVGPLDGDRLRPDLSPSAVEPGGVSLGRLLATVVGEVYVEQRTGGAWIRFEKRRPGATIASR